MNQFIIWHRLRGHHVVNTGVCDLFGSVMKYCATCQERGEVHRWRIMLGGGVSYSCTAVGGC